MKACNHATFWDHLWMEIKLTLVRHLLYVVTGETWREDEIFPFFKSQMHKGCATKQDMLDYFILGSSSNQSENNYQKM